jgi:hypothetical protein
MNADTLLRLDHATLPLGVAGFVGIWPRCSPWLLRLARERKIRQFWSTRRPEVAACSYRAQLLALGNFVDADTQQRTTQLWHVLGRRVTTTSTNSRRPALSFDHGRTRYAWCPPGCALSRHHHLPPCGEIHRPNANNAPLSCD